MWNNFNVGFLTWKQLVWQTVSVEFLRVTSDKSASFEQNLANERCVSDANMDQLLKTYLGT